MSPKIASILRTILISSLVLYPLFELSRIILSYLSGYYWITSPLSLELMTKGQVWSPWCYWTELAIIWIGYLLMIFILYKQNKYIYQNEKNRWKNGKNITKKQFN
jgi:hypothetical protein